jgi:hypothetical protein
VVRNNLSNKQWNLGNTFSNNLVSSNPLFTNAAAFDFTLTSTSPAIDYGMVIPGITINYLGANPDAGAYEYGLTPWLPGTSVIPPDISDLVEDSLQTTGIQYPVSENGITVYPNPTTSLLNIDAENIGDCKIELYDIHGRIVLENKNVRSLDLSHYENGLYLLILTNLNTHQINHFMVVKKK